MYRYLVIYDRSKKILYGECIFWEIGQYDLEPPRDISINLKRNHKAKIFSSDRPVEILDGNLLKILDLEFSYDETFDDFIKLTMDEELYNPLIDRCSKVKIFIGKDFSDTEYLSWAENEKSLLGDIKSRFDIDLLRHPELINSFGIYNPTRILNDFKFDDTAAKNLNEKRTNFSLTLYDEIEGYAGADYIVSCHFKDGSSISGRGSIEDKEVHLELPEHPHELELEIRHNGCIAYQSRHGFIEKVTVQATTIGDSVVLENGESITKSSTSIFDIGKKK